MALALIINECLEQVADGSRRRVRFPYGRAQGTHWGMGGACPPGNRTPCQPPGHYGVVHELSVLARVVFLFTIFVNAAVVHAAGTTPSEAGAVGQEISGIIECGQGYTSHELYDVKITLLELSRGEQAWRLLSRQDGANKPPPPGYDYILARIKVGYFARGRPGTCVHMVKQSHFTAYSRKGEPYPNPELAVRKPPLNGSLKSGESITGWVAFEVARDDAEPLMFYSVDDAGAVQHGGKLWFKLY